MTRYWRLKNLYGPRGNVGLCKGIEASALTSLFFMAFCPLCSSVFKIVERHAAVRKGQVADEMLAADHALDRQIRNRCIDVRNQLQARRRKPDSFDLDFSEIVGHKLADFRIAVDVGNDLEIARGPGHALGLGLRAAGCALPLVAHRADGDRLTGITQRTGQRVGANLELRLGIFLWKA